MIRQRPFWLKTNEDRRRRRRRMASDAQRDAADGVCWNFGIGFLPADPEEHVRAGGDGGGGVQGLSQPAMGSTLVQFHCHLQETGRGTGCGLQTGCCPSDILLGVVTSTEAS